ncbi:NAD(P)H-hydrate dehydratase [Allosphingosinicella indica]|uniref:Bifunctional NAD(P)H-hydrate repair enzyme n=1 Tax=Allosphingosinicella indica TaxID=941907 RepID=A0A1X7FXP4_9SPHN|nr:NAD(P)H-hydrate dehydratase [Allosphingosinicella indica]SMF60596.1 yjeF C-terminal region, hydroxyethylthiazole kinase-related/yjeF N-terminal region [Allosphingosinicella indica]
MSERPIWSAAEMRAAEEAAIAAGTPVETLMDRAGRAAAEAIWRFAGPLPALVLCGPGNNGGDGYVIARVLKARGMDVAVAALGDPKTPAAHAAAGAWAGPVATFESAEPRPLLIDALFGTGLRRSLDDGVAAQLAALAEDAAVRVAVDLPSGVATHDGALLSPVPVNDLTITFATLKPAHRLQPAARHMGRIVVAAIGVAGESALAEIGRPLLRAPGPDDHKYKRGFVLVAGGDLAGAAELAAEAALRAGAGAVRLLGVSPSAALPRAIMQSGTIETGLDDDRLGAVVFGPGTLPGPESDLLLTQLLASDKALVLDAGALVLLANRGPDALRGLPEPAILTPHPGEFSRLFGEIGGSKVDRARAAAARSGAVVVDKGPDTVVAAPDGRAGISAGSSPWLATAGSGDVLAGAIAAARAAGFDAFAAAKAGVWLHQRAAEIAGPGLIADDVVEALALAFAECT